ncbi:YIP1 family protein [Plastorhodobacter daqingensis]|uniref:YIP1 family protein n=1 Tax=Plastorhodobacter daqingensis TaxID=1387281 RepID=A0ABW2UFV2_9RHOB
MSITRDVVQSYRAPRGVVRRLLAAGPREDRALAYLMIASLLIFVAQWPRLAREAHLAPEIPLEARLGGALMAMIFMFPLLCYALAALAHLVARLLGGRGSWYGARLALFWSLLVVSPLMLVHGAAVGFLGGGPLAFSAGLVVLAVFLLIWGSAMREAEGAGAAS